ncbi:MAG: M16 family metallopeptidase, partial [Sphingomonadaceae bacterium]
MKFLSGLLPLALVTLALFTSPLSAQELATHAPFPAAEQSDPWGLEGSDLKLDPAWHIGTLENGMRFIIRRNSTPRETAIVRLHIGSGSLSETESERGLAHFLEHMAFNGSNKIPEGEMIKLLERKGLSFGADTNASTGFDATVYKLDLPQNSPDLLDTALMLMRETASELTLAEDAVDRERGVLLAEMRDRRTYQLKNLEDQIAFITPGARYANRLPFGTEDVLKQASAEDIRGYYAREYVPANTVLVVIGDYDPHMVETEIRRYFSGWKAAPRPAPATAGPVDIMAQGQSDIYLDPSLPERIRIA